MCSGEKVGKSSYKGVAALKKPKQDGKRKVIIITDGDEVARMAVEAAARQVGGRVISRSAGNPTPLNGQQLVKLIQEAKHDPVLVMFDDNGDGEESYGERALREIATHPLIEVLGAVAVASKTPYVEGTPVDFSIDNQGHILYDEVDKDGRPSHTGQLLIHGDTVDVLKELDIPIIIGMGDPGKMEGHDHVENRAPVTTAAVQEILKRSGFVSEMESQEKSY
ncbi:stage V sporulation protein AE [Collibacillus ludicampi]|uniref:Stage V sporulation protein AE n=1 Tax=Collibacillus ludicampi TaxID=2771369 RepID=A0AAV4LKR1_9BACL|nr:stage V sporulation protein AE [Collibacillus ludicampi]